MEEKEIQEIIEKKQKYLRDEILNKNYDAEEFSEFISKYKENGLDLSNWTFDELKDAVQKFKNKNQGETKEEEDEKLIEKEVENIKKSYIINGTKDLITKSDNNNNLDNKNNENNINNKNNCLDFDIIDYVNDDRTNDKKKIRIMNSSIRIAELDLENESINKIVNIQKFSNNSNKNEQNINKDNRVEIIENNNDYEANELIQNNNINNNNDIIQYTNEKESICSDFEILDNPYKNKCNNNSNNNTNNIYNNNANNIYNNNIGQNNNDLKQFKFKCVKQPENSLTNKNDLYINLEI